jgi:hypothetical protein
LKQAESEIARRLNDLFEQNKKDETESELIQTQFIITTKKILLEALESLCIQ